MALYLSSLELVARVHLGKEVEQWLSYYREADYTVIRWLIIYKDESQFTVAYHESFDEGDEGFHDVYEFSALDPDDDTTHSFDSVEEAVAFAIENYGAAADRFVAGGMIQEEYAKYVRVRK
ncbi:hypothetical protein [Hymenobacter sp. GOD-10R]|uniref:hypothetical protein n=1 Tax=Hymenobacter sp. GOD-10R TaxID=3093922 RepID=UPI002D792D63|nr:hypothetical protein [Hymenobacter sp. GOD-10R]WRQ28918.1 hypothetical protein SD425_01395 [Hymenobacter sp. GOD-10R]